MWAALRWTTKCLFSRDSRCAQASLQLKKLLVAPEKKKRKQKKLGESQSCE